ncbi:MAG: efflux transporter periplasmic adaptor subunit [Pirellula sp.]|nr:efflux transporter periplasmic adaptor subunit [Pirellula sp.]
MLHQHGPPMFSFVCRRHSAACLCVIATVFLTSMGCKSEPAAPAEAITPKVTVADVISQEIVDTDEYTGQTEASEIVEVRSRIFGFLKSIDFKDGDFVKEGQTLFTIEPEEYQAIHEQSLAKIAVNNANLELSRSKLAMKERLRPNGAISQEEYEEAIAAVHEAEATIAAAQADANRTAIDVKYTVIEAPISGRIDRALVSKGNLLTGGQSSGTLLTTIVNEQPMYVYFDVDERSLLRYMRQRTPEQAATPGSMRDMGLACYLQLADEKDFPHAGVLDFASAQVNASTGTARLRGVFENADHALASGLFVRIQIPVSKPYEALLIPERALSTDQNIKFVYVVDEDGIANRRVVELGTQRGDLRVITAGLSAGERVIVKGLQRVKPGQHVEAEPELTSAAKPTS